MPEDPPQAQPSVNVGAEGNMTTLAHRISRLLPRPAAAALRPVWHVCRDISAFILRQGGRIGCNRGMRTFTASREFAGRRLTIAVRSYQELRRFHQFGTFEGDIVQRWMACIDDCDVLYDVGSANGLEGLYVHHLHGCKIIFIEPFTPSIESIMKSIGLRNGGDGNDFEVVHAACDERPSYQRLYMHEGPIPGSTNNSFAHPEEYDRGGRSERPVLLSQWAPSVSLDSLHWDYGLPLATHVKIDIDGFEDRAMRGAARLLASGHVRSWVIELNGIDNRDKIRALMAAHGYVETGSWNHYPGYVHYTADHVFIRADLESQCRKQVQAI